MINKHGNTGNRNAALDSKPLETVHIKCTVKEKAAWVKYCQHKGQTLSQAIREAMRGELGNENIES